MFTMADPSWCEPILQKVLGKVKHPRKKDVPPATDKEAPKAAKNLVMDTAPPVAGDGAGTGAGAGAGTGAGAGAGPAGAGNGDGGSNSERAKITTFNVFVLLHASLECN